MIYANLVVIEVFCFRIFGTVNVWVGIVGLVWEICDIVARLNIKSFLWIRTQTRYFFSAVKSKWSVFPGQTEPCGDSRQSISLRCRSVDSPNIVK